MRITISQVQCRQTQHARDVLWGGLRVSSLFPAAGKSSSEVMCHGRGVGGGGGTKWKGDQRVTYVLYNVHV